LYKALQNLNDPRVKEQNRRKKLAQIATSFDLTPEETDSTPAPIKIPETVIPVPILSPTAALVETAAAPAEDTPAYFQQKMGELIKIDTNNNNYLPEGSIDNALNLRSQIDTIVRTNPANKDEFLKIRRKLTKVIEVALKKSAK